MSTPTDNLPAERVAREQRRQELAAVTFQPNGQMFQPKDGRELMDMANLMSTAGLMVKDIYRNNPGACMGLIAVCAPYGLNPLQVSWKTYQTKQDAPIAYEAQVIVAMVNASGAIKGGLRYEFEGEGQNRRCRAYATIKGSDEVLDVWTPPLKDITPKNSPLWKTDPDQQAAYYAGRSWARRHKPEMLLGIYDVDEMEGVAIGPNRARDVTPAEPARGGFAAKAMAARPQPVEVEPEPEPEDAEIVGEPMPGEDTPPDEAQEAAETAQEPEDVPDTSDPMSTAFGAGARAFASGKPITACPFKGGQSQADWLAGWSGASKAAEGAEA